jgi:hypothetical protein
MATVWVSSTQPVGGVKINRLDASASFVFRNASAHVADSHFATRGDSEGGPPAEASDSHEGDLGLLIGRGETALLAASEGEEKAPPW